MKTINLFLAVLERLESEREQISVQILQLNNVLEPYGIRLQLGYKENFVDFPEETSEAWDFQFSFDSSPSHYGGKFSNTETMLLQIFFNWKLISTTINNC